MRRFFRWIRIPVPRHTMPPPGRIEAATAAPTGWQAPRSQKIPPELEDLTATPIADMIADQVTISRDDWLRTGERIDILTIQLQQAEAEARWHKRHAQKLQERVNRIAKLTPGRQRINELHRVATQFEHEIVRAPERWQADLRADVLFHRRLAWDLGELRDEVRGDKRMPGARTDPTMFRGERP